MLPPCLFSSDILLVRKLGSLLGDCETSTRIRRAGGHDAAGSPPPHVGGSCRKRSENLHTRRVLGAASRADHRSRRHGLELRRMPPLYSVTGTPKSPQHMASLRLRSRNQLLWRKWCEEGTFQGLGVAEGPLSARIHLKGQPEVMTSP